MKTFARARAVMLQAMKSVKAIAQEDHFSIDIPAPDFKNMGLHELREMAKEEGILRGGKYESELREELEEAYWLYPSESE